MCIFPYHSNTPRRSLLFFLNFGFHSLAFIFNKHQPLPPKKQDENKKQQTKRVKKRKMFAIGKCTCTHVRVSVIYTRTMRVNSQSQAAQFLFACRLFSVPSPLPPSLSRVCVFFLVFKFIFAFSRSHFVDVPCFRFGVLLFRSRLYLYALRKASANKMYNANREQLNALRTTMTTAAAATNSRMSLERKRRKNHLEKQQLNCNSW